MKNECYTYFRIVGQFDTKEISNILGLNPERMWDIGDTRPNGSTYEFACWVIGYCRDYNVDLEIQMQKTIEPLLDKKNELRKIREKYDVEFYLEVVPTLYVNESTPALAPSMNIIDFCYETRTKIDIDLYLDAE